MGSQIDKLMEKYWAGTTSLQEEEEIRDFYKKNHKRINLINNLFNIFNKPTLNVLAYLFVITSF